MIVKNKTFENQDVALDGNQYEGCKFFQCNLIVRATDKIGLVGCDVEQCTIVFDGAALRTMNFLSAMYQSGNKEFVEGMFDGIRKGQFPSVPPKSGRPLH